MIALAAVALGLVAGAEPSPTPDPAAFPVIAEKGMKLDAQASDINVPFGFGKVEKFYREQFADRKDVALSKSEAGSEPVLTLLALGKGTRWTKAVVTTNGATCRIHVTRVVVIDPTVVSGEGPPVQFIITRSTHVKEQLDSIDHMEH
jgi:hypothetical protein